MANGGGGGRSILSVLRGTTVEPILFFTYFAFALEAISEHTVLYLSVCHQNYHDQRPEVDCRRLSQWPELEDVVQAKASRLAMYATLCSLIPASMIAIYLGAWSDKKGRKINILLAKAGLLMRSVIWISLYVFPQMNYAWLLSASFLVGFTGYINMVVTMSLAYLSDVVKDKSQLTFRMIIVLTGKGLADCIGSFVLSRLLTVVQLSTALILAQCVYGIGFFYSLFRLRQRPPTSVLVPVTKDNSALSSSTTAEAGKSSRCCGTCWSVFRSMAGSYREVWASLVVRRTDHRRAYALLSHVIFFFYMMTDFTLLSGPITTLYVYHRPFNWSPSQLGVFKSVQSVCGLVGVGVGAALKRLFGLSEITLMLLSALSGCGQMLMMGLAFSDWMLYVAICIGIFNALLIPSLTSFLVLQVDQDEKGKALAMNGITAALAQVAGAFVFADLYSRTVARFAGTVYIISGICMGFSALIVACMWIDSRRMQKRIRPTDRWKPPRIDDEISSHFQESRQ